MSLKDILVHIDSSPAATARLALAAALAQRHGAHLIGLQVTDPSDDGSVRGSAAGTAEAAEALFSRLTAAAGLSAEFRSLTAAPGTTAGIVKALIRQAHASDLVVVSQSRPGSRGAGIAERLILACGRPVLVVPSAGSFPVVGERVLVAWSSGRGACRALHEALPILRRAAKVTLLEINGKGRVQSGAEDLRDHLARHGVTASLERKAPLGAAIGDLLLNRACDEGDDLLVMGTGNPSSSGSPAIGAVAAQILRQMTIPVLLAY